MKASTKARSERVIKSQLFQIKPRVYVGTGASNTLYSSQCIYQWHGDARYYRLEKFGVLVKARRYADCKYTFVLIGYMFPSRYE